MRRGSLARVLWAARLCPEDPGSRLPNPVRAPPVGETVWSEALAWLPTVTGFFCSDCWGFLVVRIRDLRKVLPEAGRETEGGRRRAGDRGREAGGGRQRLARLQGDRRGLSCFYLCQLHAPDAQSAACPPSKPTPAPPHPLSGPHARTWEKKRLAQLFLFSVRQSDITDGVAG